jgi:hypothetical protein
VAIGNSAVPGYNNQGTGAIAIGNQAGYTNQIQNSIVINASNPAVNSRFSTLYLSPITQANANSYYQLRNIMYDPTFKEVIWYSANPSVYSKTFV